MPGTYHSAWYRQWRQLLCDLVQLVGRWWRAGQIRVSPREGQLLRIRSGDIVEFEGRRLIVVSWSLAPAGTAAAESLPEPPREPDDWSRWRLRLECEGDDGWHCRLLIEPPAANESAPYGSAAAPTVELIGEEGTRRRLDPDELSVYFRADRLSASAECSSSGTRRTTSAPG